ncbi:MAG TPA: P-II family nitrogen regulator [Anaeromyxobacter sp.]
MTSIEAIIRPSSLDAAIEALDHAWIQGITVDEVKRYGCQERPAARHRGAGYDLDMDPELKVQVVVPDPLVPRVLHDLGHALRGGECGDGKIFVSRVEEAVRVRTGERGEAAL